MLPVFRQAQPETFLVRLRVTETSVVIAGLIICAGIGLLVMGGKALAISATAGAVLGLPIAKALRADQKAGWLNWAAQCTSFGAAGGIIGTLIIGLLTAHEVVTVATNEPTMSVSEVPIHKIYVPDPPSTTAEVKVPIVTDSVMPAQEIVTAETPQPAKLVHKDNHNSSRVTEAEPELHENILNTFARDRVVHIPSPTPRTILAASGNPLDIRGPCADARVACVERVYFNQDGEATKIVLETTAFQHASPHYERWKGITAPDASTLSLVIPLVNRQATTMATSGLSPA